MSQRKAILSITIHEPGLSCDMCGAVLKSGDGATGVGRADNPSDWTLMCGNCVSCLEPPLPPVPCADRDRITIDEFFRGKEFA